MQNINKPQLINQLIAIFKAIGIAPSDAFDEPALRHQIGAAIDSSMLNMLQVESRRVTILLSDLRGFTAVAAKYSALEMMATLNRYFEKMSEIILDHGGTIDKFMGDAIMAVFGAPNELDDDIAAISCAVEMQLAMDDINEENKTYGMAPLYMGIGINTGEVVAGNLGSRLHSEYTVIGDQVNLASRVEAHSLRGQILLSESTYQQTRDFIEIGDINEVSVKGKKGAVRLYELLSTSRPRFLAAPRREIRKGPRIEVDMPLAFQVLKGKSVLPQEHKGRIIDISYGGMYVVSPVPLEPFEDVKIALSLSLMGYEMTEIYAKVLRVSKTNEEYMCQMEFTSIEPKAQQTIKEFVDGLVEIK
jgi:adenylate cyclase